MASQGSQPNVSFPTLSQPHMSQPSASQPPLTEPHMSHSCASEGHEAKPTEKLYVRIDEHGKPVGPNSAKFCSRAGKYIKAKIPVFYSTWKEVKQTFKDDVWNTLTAEFKFNLPYSGARKFLEKDFPPKWRVIKSRFKNKYLKDCATAEEALQICPDNVDPMTWRKFILRVYSSKFKETCQQNAVNRKKNPSDHCLGRQTYAQKLYLMDEENPEVKHGRVDAWLKGHEHPDGTVLESVQEKYQQVKIAHERNKSLASTEEGMEYFEDMDTDALAEVFGPEKKTRTRGLSSNASKKQLEYVAIGKALLQQAGSSNSKLETQMNGMQSQMNKMNDVLMAFINQASVNSASCATPTPTPATNTPQVEVGSSSAHRTFQPIPRNLTNLFETTNHGRGSSVSPKVSLLDRNQNVVAEGFVVTDETAGICHGRLVLPGEKKVLVQKVFNGDAPIYDGPQDGMETLHAIVDGGYLVWLEARLKY